MTITVAIDEVHLSCMAIRNIISPKITMIFSNYHLKYV